MDVRNKLNSYNVEVSQDSKLLTVITVKAKDEQEAATKAREQFFVGIKAKVKKAYA